ncbi:MAG TPA: sulfurtransferase TusA family protein [Bacteroidales bacterium]|mgnify:CR=1 FL=1|nr:sulfurtransferase TusA family protein [Bacteroidales bacterium]HPR57358.1 sulfurtransferase TusA family protein [Bacteroidales bacterium]
MTKEELKALEIAKSVDARGTACPGPLLAAKKAIGEIEEGEIMEVLSADEGTKRDIPKWAEKKGYDYLGDIEENGYFKMYLRKN